MIVIGIDLETTGFDHTQDEIIEVGAVLWDTEAKIPLRIVSELVHAEREITKEITGVTGITRQMIDEYGVPPDEARSRVYSLIYETPVMVAHNGKEFDEKFFRAWWPGGCGIFTEWIDTRTDIVYPERISTRSLTCLAAEHGFLNPFKHRAVFDVLTMLRVLSEYDIEAVLVRAREPIVYVTAIVSFVDKDKAKERGFMWHPTRRIWWKSMKRCDYLPEASTYNFPTALLEEKPE